MGCGKRRYNSRKEAKSDMKKLNKTQGNRFNLKNQYFCEECTGWHTTSIDRKDFRDGK